LLNVILATEQSNPSPVVPGHVSDRRHHDRYQHLNILLFETTPQAHLFYPDPSPSEKLDIDCAHDDTIPALMLSYAAQANENGLVLFPPWRVASEQECEGCVEPDISPAQAALFEQFVKRSSVPRTTADTASHFFTLPWS
jgi:hypothetical protein